MFSCALATIEFMFAIFVDSLVDKVKATGIGCYFKFACVSVFLYADDILLIAPSVNALHILLNACIEELSQLDMCINVNKSLCKPIRFRKRYNVDCACPLLSKNEPAKMRKSMSILRFLLCQWS